MAETGRVKEDSILKHITFIYGKHNLSQIDKDILFKL